MLLLMTTLKKKLHILLNVLHILLNGPEIEYATMGVNLYLI